MTVREWGDLDPDERLSLLRSPSRETDVQVFLLDFDLNETQDLTRLVYAKDGSIQWDGSRVVHRDISLTFTLADPLPWGIALVKVYKIYRDRITGLTARRARGVFCLSQPDVTLGRKTLNPDTLEYDQTVYPVTGQDLLYLLDRPVTYTYVIDEGTNILGQIRQVFSDAGFPPDVHATITSNASASVMPKPYVYPLIASSSSDADTTTNGSEMTSAAFGDPAFGDDASSQDTTTWLTIINDLLKLINYRKLWCDENGKFRCEPYLEPAVAPLAFTFDSDDQQQSTVAIADRVVTSNVWARPNSWLGIWTNMPPDSNGDTVDPTYSNGGLLLRENRTDGLSSIDARNGFGWQVRVEIQAATADDFAAQLDTRVATDKRAVIHFSYSTRQYAEAGHFDVFGLQDADAGGFFKVQAKSWTEPLNYDPMTWEWESI